MPDREQQASAPPFRGLAWARDKLLINTHGELEALTARAGEPVSRPTIVRMDGDFPGSHRPYRPRPDSVLAVREALELHRMERFGARHIVAGHARVHLCLIARDYEPHFFWESGRWEQFTAGMDYREALGWAARVQRERQGLTRHQVAGRSQAFGADWAVQAKTVKAIERGAPCRWDSLARLGRVLDVRGDFRNPGMDQRVRYARARRRRLRAHRCCGRGCSRPGRLT